MAFNINPPTTRVNYPFNGHLNPNEVAGTIFNMIINQYIKKPDLANNYNFVERFRTEASMHGDTVLFYDQPTLHSRVWRGDLEATELLNTERPGDPKCQAITLNKFRMVKTTLDTYLSKRAWSTEGVFMQFHDIVKSLISEAKTLHEVTMMNTFIGTMTGGAAKSNLEIPLSDITETGEAKNRLTAQTIAQYIADLIVELKDYSEDYNDYGFTRAYTEDQIQIIWNSRYVNLINKIDLPTIFNKSGLMDKFEQNILPSKYFGEIIDGTSLDSNLTVGEDGKIVIGAGYTGPAIRTMDEDVFEESGHRYPGGLLKIGDAFTPGRAYAEDGDIIAKVITNDTVKYLSSFETATEFFNAQALLTNNMLIWGFAEPTRLLGQPCVTIHAD